MKKITFILLIIFSVVSLVFNTYQYKTISSYQSKQNLNNAELKSTIGALNAYLRDRDFATIKEKELRACSAMSERIFTLVRNSSYNSNHDVVDCFTDVNNLFFGMGINELKIDGEQIKVLLKSTINEKDNEINPDGCKKLSTFIRGRY